MHLQNFRKYVKNSDLTFSETWKWSNTHCQRSPGFLELDYKSSLLIIEVLGLSLENKTTGLMWKNTGFGIR